MAELTHFDEGGRARMVDVSQKNVTVREARARAELKMNEETLARIRNGEISKGDVLAVAQVAAIMAAKRTSDLIPMCHPLPISGVSVNFAYPANDRLQMEVVVVTDAKTGVEMEALTAVSIGALTVYDMCKAIDREMTIEFIGLMEKSGGKSGLFVRSV